MVKISSRQTFYYRYVFPVFWFGLSGIFLIILLGNIASGVSKVPAPLALMPIVMMGFGYLLIRFLVSDLVDEVYDDGDALLVKYKDIEERVALANIVNIGLSFTNPRRVTLSLRDACRFGTKIVFIPRLDWSDGRRFWLQSRLVDDLILRADAARLTSRH